MIKREENLFSLHTTNTTYLFQVLASGHLEHLYYGSALGEVTMEDADALMEKRAFEAGNTICYDPAHKTITLEDLRLEVSGRGKGDLREPFVELTFADGSRTTDFLFAEARIEKLPDEMLPNVDKRSDTVVNGRAGDKLVLPHAYDEAGEAERLTIVLKEAVQPVRLELYYDVFADCDVICRSAKLFNEGNTPVVIERLLSTQLDFSDSGYMMGGFFGAWAREMNRVDLPVLAGKQVVSSVTGSSSNRANPFVMLFEEDATEKQGICYGFHLLYSGNHYEAAEVNAYGKTRFCAGINPDSFSWNLQPGDSFESPQSAMTVSGQGFAGMSHQMHAFIREHIVRGAWKKKVRPVLLNSWEAAYFDIDEKKLLKLAQKASEVGIELFVMDDGWFGNRDNDQSSLGDWYVNKKKLPGGLAGICKKINDLGLQFGIWVEPEMVNTDSDLYRAHPDWAMEIPGRAHSEGRNQRVLDLANPEVVDYMIERMTEVFSSANIAYVKWDMNRIFSDVYSPYLAGCANVRNDDKTAGKTGQAGQMQALHRQGETAHRYICGFYRMAETLTKRFPDILFEGCAAGGNRFDAGMLCYFPQIWASDNTDPISRARIQEGYSYGYPLSVISAHVSGSPNHQTLRTTPLDTRFAVAMFGSMGYECNLVDMRQRDLEIVKEQVEQYKKWREVIQFGDFYRVNRSCGKTQDHNRSPLRSWICVSKDKKRAVGMLLQEMVTANTQYANFRAEGLDPQKTYHFYNKKIDQSILQFGDLINTVAPFHVRQDSLTHHVIARFQQMPGEQEYHRVSGTVLMNAGISLMQGFSGTGYDENVRYFQDYSARIYYMEAR
ncbi:MAG: alpha-galactosidase [Eubacterium sp.]|nr:alpha-galactosidase [Eubacterium sp.]